MLIKVFSYIYTVPNGKMGTEHGALRKMENWNVGKMESWKERITWYGMTLWVNLLKAISIK